MIGEGFYGGRYQPCMVGKTEYDARRKKRPNLFEEFMRLDTREALKTISNKVMWITRVPEVLKSAKSAIRSITSKEMRRVGQPLPTIVG